MLFKYNKLEYMIKRMSSKSLMTLNSLSITDRIKLKMENSRGWTTDRQLERPSQQSPPTSVFGLFFFTNRRNDKMTCCCFCVTLTNLSLSFFIISSQILVLRLRHVRPVCMESGVRVCRVVDYLKLALLNKQLTLIVAIKIY